MIWMLLACGTAPAPEPAPAPDRTGVAEITAVAGPVARIGGRPILERPVVIGGLETDAIARTLAQQAGSMTRCSELAKQRSGKVLVRFVVDANGRVHDPRVHSTSLRSSTAEDCIVNLVGNTRFPQPTQGTKAIVTWPFTVQGIP